MRSPDEYPEIKNPKFNDTESMTVDVTNPPGAEPIAMVGLIIKKSELKAIIKKKLTEIILDDGNTLLLINEASLQVLKDFSEEWEEVIEIAELMSRVPNLVKRLSGYIHIPMDMILMEAQTLVEAQQAEFERHQIYPDHIPGAD